MSFPPKAQPALRPLRFPNNILKLLSNSLELIPEQAYVEEVVVAPGPPRMVFITGPDQIKSVIQDCWDTFPRGKLKTTIMEPLIGNSLGQCEREDWTWQRRAITPLFRHDALLDYGPVIETAAANIAQTWRGAEPEIYRPVSKDMLRASFQVISNTLLTGMPEGFLEEIEKGHEDYFSGMNWWIAYAMLGLPHWFPRPGGRRMRAYERRIRNGVAEFVRTRRQTGATNSDMLARWFSASDPETGRRLSDELVRDNIISLLFSGYETVALALTWALYLVSQNHEWETKVLDEVERVVGDGPVTSGHAGQLTVVQQVIDETLRLYPPVPFIVRDVKRDVQIGGISVRRGTTAFIPVYAVHRHRKLWDDPDRFDPGRFSKERRSKISRYQFIPYGAGPRICIGAAFAAIELVMLLATFVRAARFEILPNFHPVPVGRSVLVPKRGMPMNVILRDEI